MLRKVFDGRATSIFIQFLMVLNEHGRGGLLRSVLTEFQSIRDQRHGVVPVEVWSAVELDDVQQENLRQHVTTLVDGDPVIYSKVDPSLLGGLVVQVHDTVYDSSVRTKLRRMRDLMIQRSANEIQSRRDQFSNSAGN
jgi:F-type H+-transporting ATPase subunit delta